MRTLKSTSCIAVFASLSLSICSVEAIENVRGKTYNLTEKHGPWMIMVTSFRNIHEDDRKTEGLSAEQAASELVFELREKGIPAYSFSQDGKVESIETRDRLGRDDTRIFAAQRDMICVLAGNYDSIDDGVAQKTLNYVKKFYPKFLKNTKNGAVVRSNLGQKGPLAGAFMTTNPLRRPEDIASKKIDNETKFLNSGIDNALIGLKKKYTLQVATFSGKSTTPIGSSAYRGKEGQFDKELKTASGFNIVRSGEDAAQLARSLRQDKIEAYVYHDKFQSIVTVGGFDEKDDPRLRQIYAAFRAKMKPDPQSNSNQEILTPETKILRGQGTAITDAPLQVWVFDYEPQLIEVPRVK